MLNTRNRKVCCVRTDLFLRKCLFYKKIQISVISIINNHPWALKHYSTLLVELGPDHGWINYQTLWDTWGNFSRICVGSF